MRFHRLWRPIGLAVLLVALWAPAVRAGDPDALRVNPFASVAAGDWWVLDSNHTSTIEWVVDRVDGDTIFITGRCLRGAPTPAWNTTASKSAPSLCDLYGLGRPGAPTLVDVDFDALGRTFHARKLTNGDVTAWLSPDVKGGLLASSMALATPFPARGPLPRRETALVGYGTGLDLSQKDPYATAGFHVERGKSGPEYVKADDMALGGGTPDAPDPALLKYLSVESPPFGYPAGGAGLSKGFWISSRRVDNNGHVEEQKEYRVVAETADAWLVETKSPNTSGFTEALTLKKADGTILRARAGSKGGALVEIKIVPPTVCAPPLPTRVTTTDDVLTTKAGTFKAQKTVTVVIGPGAGSQSKPMSVWRGVEGEAAGLVLKNDNVELTALATEDWPAGPRTLRARHLTFSDGSEVWMVGEELPFFGFTVREKIPGGTVTEVSVGAVAAQELEWGEK